MKGVLDNAFKGAIATYISTALNIIAGLVIPIVLVRHLSVEAYGSYKLILSLLVVASVMTSFGLESVISRYIPEIIVNKGYQVANKVFLSCLSIRFFATFFFLLCLFYLKQPIFNFFQFPEFFSAFFLPIASLILIILTKRVLGPPFLNALMDQHIDCFNNVIYTVIKIFSFVVVLTNGYGLEGLVLAWIAAEFVAISFYFIVSVNRTLKFRGLHKEEAVGQVFDKKRYIKFGLYNFMSSNLVVFHDLYIDNLVILKYVSVEKVGIYGLAGTIVGLSLMFDPGRILKNVYNTILVSKYSEKQNLDVLFKGYHFLNKISLFLFIPAMVGVFLICDKIIIFIFNPEYIESASILVILIPFFIFRTLMGPLSQVIGILEKNHIFLFCGFSSLYNLIMDLVLVQYFGIEGIAWATGSAILFLYLIYFWGIKFYHYQQITFPFRILFKISINIFPMIVFLLFAREYITNLFLLVLVVIMSIPIYFFTSYVNKVFNDEERTLINKTIGNKIWVF
jgi:O-antigen/teichoic acid export membrane protein